MGKTTEDLKKEVQLIMEGEKWKNLSDKEKHELSALLSNEAMNDETVMRHPKQTLAFIAKVGGEKFIEESLPQVDIWVENGEDVSMKRVKDWLIDKYELFKNVKK